MYSAKYLVFDLDGTLYDISNGYMNHIRENLFRMMVNKGYARDRDDAEAKWKPLFKKHNQSFKGLNAGGYLFTNDEYWAEHRAGMERYFKPDLDLYNLLTTLPYEKIIFTNCREIEADHILNLTGINDCFRATYGADFMGDCCKPEASCFEKLLDKLQCSAENIVYFEDSVKNLKTAQSIGMQCVLIHSATACEEGVNITKMGEEHGLRRYSIEGFSSPVVVLDTLNDGGKQLMEALPDLFKHSH